MRRAEQLMIGSCDARATSELASVVRLRWAALVAQGLALLVATLALGIALPVMSLALILAIVHVTNVALARSQRRELIGRCCCSTPCC